MIEIVEEILIQVPKYVEIYVFGSVLKSFRPNDLDILVIYDSNIYPNTNIYTACENICTVLYKTFNLPLDLTVLSYSENDSVNFDKEVKAIKLEYFLQKTFLKMKLQ